MKSIPRFERTDRMLAAVFFLVALAIRVPLRTMYGYHWDSGEFSVAIDHYNVALNQPHAPGYFLYVMLGRLLNVFVGNPHASLVWLSLLSGSGMVAVLYL